MAPMTAGDARAGAAANIDVDPRLMEVLDPSLLLEDAGGHGPVPGAEGSDNDNEIDNDNGSDAISEADSDYLEVQADIARLDASRRAFLSEHLGPDYEGDGRQASGVRGRPAKAAMASASGAAASASSKLTWTAGATTARRRRGPRKAAEPSGEVKSRLQHAHQLFMDARYEEALEALQEIIRVNAETHAAWSLMASINEDLGRREDALMARVFAAHLEPKNVAGWLSAADHALAEAAAADQEADDEDGEDGEDGEGGDGGSRDNGTAPRRESRRLQNLQIARLCYSGAIRADKDSIAARLGKANVCLEFGQATNAATEYVRVLKRRPLALQVIRNLAEASYDSVRGPETIGAAIRAYARAVAHLQAQTQMQAQMQTQMQAQMQAQARARPAGCVAPYLQLDAGETFAWMDVTIYVELYAALGQYAEAVAVLKNLARWMLGRGGPDEAYWAAAASQEDSGGDDDDCEWDRDDEPRRIRVPGFRPGRYPRTAYGEGLPVDLRAKLAIYRLKLGHDDEAIEHLSWIDPQDARTIESMRLYPHLLKDVGAELFASRRFELALQYLELYRDLNRSLAAELAEGEGGGEGDGDSDDDDMDTAAAVSAENDDAEALVLQGKCNLELHDHAAAEESFLAAIEADDENIDARFELAKMYEKAQEKEQAYILVNEALSLEAAQQRRQREAAAEEEQEERDVQEEQEEQEEREEREEREDQEQAQRQGRGQEAEQGEPRPQQMGQDGERLGRLATGPAAADGGGGGGGAGGGTATAAAAAATKRKAPMASLETAAYRVFLDSEGRVVRRRRKFRKGPDGQPMLISAEQKRLSKAGGRPGGEGVRGPGFGLRREQLQLQHHHQHHTKQRRRRILRGRSRRLFASPAEQAEFEASTSARLRARYQHCQEIKGRANGGDADATAEWMEAARELINDFRSFREFYTWDKYVQFLGVNNLLYADGGGEGGGGGGVDDGGGPQKSGLTALAERLHQNGQQTTPTADGDARRDYRGIPFDDWLALFLEYALALAHAGRTREAYGVCQSAHDSTVYRTADSMFLIHLAWAACAVRAGDEQTCVAVARYFMRDRPFTTDCYRLFTALCRLSRAPSTWFSSSPAQKYILRQIRARDEVIRVATRSGGGAPIPHLDTCLLVVYGHILSASMSYHFALNYYQRALAVDGANPVIHLCIGLAYVHWALKRQAENRQYLLTQGMNFMHQYAERRLAGAAEAAASIPRGVPDVHARREAFYNLARTYHLLGLHALAAKFYAKVLGEVSADDADEMDETDDATGTGRVTMRPDLRTEAAYNLRTYYLLAGNHAAAMQITRAYLVM